MRLIMSGINGHYLRFITDNFASQTEEVLAAVAYATPSAILFDWCWQNKIPLKFYGRLDDEVAVSIPILSDFLKRQSPDFTCRLVQHHHAKVIWWRGVGLYIGSANLTDSAWTKNIEAGCFFNEEEITDEMAGDILDLFSTLEAHATPLTEELLKEMSKREKELNTRKPEAKTFWDSPSFIKWPGLIQTASKSVADKRREDFLKEWHSTLQDLRDIGARVNRPENRPAWVNASTPIGAQADQFLHAHYYQHVERQTNYITLFEENKGRKEAALTEIITWWHKLAEAPSSEDEMLNITAPFLQAAFSEQSLRSMSYEQFRDVCMAVHSIKDYSRRVPNKKVGLLDDGTRYTISQKVDALSKRIWNDRSSGNHGVTEVIIYVLYGGSSEQLPERLWQAVSDPQWKIDGLGISAFGEMVGWAMPDRFPPRNGRTSKALKSLGYDVTIHVE